MLIFKLKKKIIVPLIISFISGIVIFYGYFLYEENRLEVPGTIIAKSESLKGDYKTSRISSEWLLAIKPDNVNYKPYTVSVSFATFASYNIGSHVTFKTSRNKVCPKWYDDSLGIVLIFYGGFCGIYSLIVFIYNIFYKH